MASRMSCPWFVGRTEELRQLIVTLEATMAGSSTTVLVRATPESGKSRLVAELSKRAAAGGAMVLTGQCLDVAEVAHRTPRSTRFLPSSGTAAPASYDRPKRCRQHCAGLPASARSCSSSRTCTGPIGRRGRFSPCSPAAQSYPACCWWRRIAPTVWARATRSAGCSPSSIEPARAPPAPGAVRARRRRRAARGILGTQPPDWLVGAVLERSDGNPFFAEELAATSGEGDIPPGLHELLLARLDRLDKNAQQVVRAAAIGGRRIGHRLLAAAVELPTAVLDAGLRDARQNHLLLVDEQGYAFRHALVHEAVLGELLPGERASLHTAFARAIDFDRALVGAAWAAALVHHWTAAGRSARAIAPALAAAVDAELAYASPRRSATTTGCCRRWTSTVTARAPTCRCPGRRSSTGRPTSPAGPATSTGLRS